MEWRPGGGKRGKRKTQPSVEEKGWMTKADAKRLAKKLGAQFYEV
jgi:hypothetical protein